MIIETNTKLFQNIRSNWLNRVRESGIFQRVAYQDLKSYTYPQRPLDKCVIVTSERGFWDYHNDFVFNEIGGLDQTFAITNDDRDAIMISLKYC